MQGKGGVCWRFWDWRQNLWGHFSEAKHQESNWSWEHLWKTFEIVRFPAFYCFQSVVHVVSERKHVPFTWKTSVICPASKRKDEKRRKKKKSFLFKRLLSDCSDIYCNEVFWTYHFPPTHETHEAPFRPIAVCVQAQQKHRRRNTSHSFAHLEKNRFIYPNSLRRLFFCFQYHITTPHGKQNFETRR